MFYDGWQGLVHVLCVGTRAYVASGLLLRMSGKRTLPKLSRTGTTPSRDHL